MNNEFTPYDVHIQHKEIDLIQSVINRMSNFQMTIKGMCISILSFLFTISVTAKFNGILMITILMIVSIIALKACYNLDLNYLKTEKLYRAWFEFIVDKRSETKEYLFELNPVIIKHILALLQTCNKIF